MPTIGEYFADIFKDLGTNTGKVANLRRELDALQMSVKIAGGIMATGSTGTLSGNYEFGPVKIDNSGLKVFNQETPTIWLQSDGDLFVGSNINAADTTVFSVFANDQTYNGESLGAGDVLLGSNSSGFANVLWDVSAKQVKFRGGTTSTGYLDTTGSMVFGDTNRTVTLSGAGLTIWNVPTGALSAVRWATSQGAPLLEIKNMYDQSDVFSSMVVTGGNVSGTLSLSSSMNAGGTAHVTLSSYETTPQVQLSIAGNGFANALSVDVGYASTTLDMRIGKGLYVGALNVDPADGTITCTGALTGGSLVINGYTLTVPATGTACLQSGFAANQVAYATDANTLDSSSLLTYDGTLLTIKKDDGNQPAFTGYAYGNNVALVGYRANGTIGSETVPLASQNIVSIGGRGWDGSAWTSTVKGYISLVTSEDWSTTNQGCEWQFATTTPASTTRRVHLKLDGNGYLALGATNAAVAPVFSVDNYCASSATAGGLVNLSSNDGAAMATGDRLGALFFRGFDSNANYSPVAVAGFAESTWSFPNPTHVHPGYLSFITTGAAADASRTERVRITAEGNVCLAMPGALATNATDGFTYIPTCAGAPTGTPTAYTGMVPMVFDSTNDALYIYRASWKHVHVA